MKMRTLVVLCSLLALYGCNGTATLKQDYQLTEIEQYHKTSATYIPVRVSIYEFSTPVTPELKELMQQSSAKVSLRPVSPSLEDELSDLTAKGEVTLLQDISAVTTNNKALPFSFLNLKKKEDVRDEISLVITPALSADAALMQMTVELSQTTSGKKNEYSHYSVNFRQLLKLKGEQKLCIAVPINDKTNRLIIITQKK
ncbi:hypothetical protein [Citrobacter portucalensis]|uniref:hypothetical protein n=1 Tax=Citrobacter portucalensis TaxID=1639133 RepID=UPI0023B09DB9|nr:hypothetical protein [Citrobacter portucalensis]EGN2315725.1 hypothetical protein [Escherichia coli]